LVHVVHPPSRERPPEKLDRFLVFAPSEVIDGRRIVPPRRKRLRVDLGRLVDQRQPVLLASGECNPVAEAAEMTRFVRI
jgi:hypothetical protein